MLTSSVAGGQRRSPQGTLPANAGMGVFILYFM